MIPKLNVLIDKQDNNEIIRDQIAAILELEKNNQVSLANAAGKNIEDFDFDVYSEKSRPWEILTSEDGDEIGQMPLVNVCFDNDTFDNVNSDQTQRQRAKGTFYIDCYAHKNRTKLEKGDSLTSKESDRIARLVRNIIMSAEYFQLALGNRELGNGKNIVWRRNITKREKIMPVDREGQYFESVIATRLTLIVEYDEFSPQIQLVNLELLYLTCKKDETEKVYFEVENDFTT